MDVRKGLVVFLLFLCLEPSLSSVHQGVQVGDGVMRSLTPELENKQEDEDAGSDLSLDMMYDAAKELENMQPSQLVVWALKFITKADFAKLERQFQQQFDKLIKAINDNMQAHDATTRYGMQSAVSSVVAAAPKRLRGGLESLWHRAFEDTYFLDSLMPLNGTKLAPPSQEIGNTTDALWHVIDEGITLAMQDRLSEFFVNVTALNTTVPVCHALLRMEDDIVTLYHNLASCHSSSQAREFLREFRDSVDGPDLPSIRPCLSLSPNAPPSLFAFAKQALSLNKITTLANDVEQLTSKWSSLFAFLAKGMGVFPNPINPAEGGDEGEEEDEKLHDVAKGGDRHVEEDTEVDPDDRVSLLEVGKGNMATVGTGVLVVVTLVAFVGYFLVYVNKMRKLATSIGYGKGVSGYSVDEIVVTSLLSLGLCIGISVLFSMVFESGSSAQSVATLQKVSQRLQSRIAKEQRIGRVKNLQHELDTKSEAELSKSSDVLGQVEEMCTKAGFDSVDCKLMDWLRAKDFAAMSDMMNQMASGKQMREVLGLPRRAQVLSPSDIKDMALFNKFFHTKGGSGVPSDLVVAKLMELGVPEKTIRIALDHMDDDRDGMVDFFDFRDFILRPPEVNFIAQTGKFQGKASAFITILLGLLVLFNSGFWEQAVYCLVVIGVGVGGVMFGTKMNAARETEINARQARDKRMEISLSAISSAMALLLFFGIVHALLFRSCENLPPQCPAPVMSESMSHNLDKECTDGCTKPEPKLHCLADLADPNSYYRCDRNLRCSYPGDMYWKQQTKQTTAASFALEQYKVANVVDSSLGDFPGDAEFRETMDHRALAKVSAVCSEEPRALPADHKIVGGRNDIIEQLLDFGAPVEEKEVKFVPLGASAPASSEEGTTVRSQAIGEEKLDFAFHEYGPSARRFPFLVPSRSVGRNFYTAYERTTAGGAWTEVTGVVYVFGAEATCGHHECADADFTESMDNQFVSRLYFTVISGTSIGYGDISPASDRARMVVALHALFMLILGAL